MIEVGSRRKQTLCFKQKLMLPYLRWHFIPGRCHNSVAILANHPACSVGSSFFVRLQVELPSRQVLVQKMLDLVISLTKSRAKIVSHPF